MRRARPLPRCPGSPSLVDAGEQRRRAAARSACACGARARRCVSAVNAAAAADADGEDRLHAALTASRCHCTTGIAAPPAVMAADRRRPARSASSMSSPPSAACRAHQLGLRLQRHRVDDQPSARPQRRARPHRARRVGSAAADEDRVGRGRSASAAGARPLTTDRSGTPSARGVAGDARGAVGARLDGDGAVRRMAQHPFDADRAGARADVPQKFALPRRQRDSVMARISRLVIWPSCSNRSSGRPEASGSTRAPGRPRSPARRC